MKLEIIEKQINQKMIEYTNGIINIDNLRNFVNKLDPKYIYKFLENPSKVKLGHVMDMIQEYDFYKINGDEQIIINIITKYTKSIKH